MVELETFDFYLKAVESKSRPEIGFVVIAHEDTRIMPLVQVLPVMNRKNGMISLSSSVFRVLEVESFYQKQL